MIKLKRTHDAPVEELDLGEFERRARTGDIGPTYLVCFEAVTGSDYVPARELELFRGLYAAGPITFRRYFHLGRVPLLTLAAIGTFVVTYLAWQGGPADAADLVRQGAKSPPLMLEQGQWWRLLTANALHVSAWHLIVNCVFLFNLGGPAEAVFRRLDYGLVLLTSALGTTTLSALFNPAVSCGASGVVFGVWGAAAVFGVRHHEILPDRYRRYFIGIVLPYSVLALYSGFTMEGVDNWGHLGGLLAGCATALFLPARLLQPRDPAVVLKLAAVAVVVFLIASGGLLPAGPGELTRGRYFARHGLEVPIPKYWDRTHSERSTNSEAHTFQNHAGVIVAVETRRERRPVDPQSLVEEFVALDLADQLRLAGVQGMRIDEPVRLTVAGITGHRIRAEFVTSRNQARADFIVLSRGYFRYILTLSAPTWMAPLYHDTLEDILIESRWVEPDELQSAKYANETSESPQNLAHLALAIAHTGDYEGATSVLRRGRERWPRAGTLMATQARLMFEHRRDLARACEVMRGSLEHSTWTPELLVLAYDLHQACDDPQTAARILDAAHLRFPNAAALNRRMRRQR